MHLKRKAAQCGEFASLSRVLYLLCVVFMLLCADVTQAAAELLDLNGASLIRPADNDAVMTITGQPATPEGMLKIHIQKASDPFWKILVNIPTLAPAPADHRVRLSFRARSATRNPVRAAIELNGAPYTNFAAIEPTLTEAWQPFEVTFTSTGHRAGALAVRFQVGRRQGSIELSDIHLLDEGLDAELVAAREALRPENIAARIDRYRKRDLQVTVRGADGKPLKDAAVTVKQTRHGFWFGTNLLSLRPGENSDWQQAYQQRFKDVFNYATLPFYWNYYEQQPGGNDDARMEEMTRWCAANGITTKGHPLVWHAAAPRWIPNDADKIVPILHSRVERLIKHYGEQVLVWEIVNEANAAPVAGNNGVSEWMKRDGAANVVGTALGWAREAGGTTPHLFTYNDFETGPANVQLLKTLQERKQLPDVIGIQSHMHQEEWSDERAWQTAERFAVFGRPLHFSEITVLSGEHRPIPVDPDVKPVAGWNSTPEGEKAQAEYLGHYYAVLFSHPAVQAITYWDLTDRDAWLGAPAGLLRADMTPKPAYERIKDLIRRQWWTDAQQTTNEQGNMQVRGFCGEYEITATNAAGTVVRKVNLPFEPDNKPLQLELQLER